MKATRSISLVALLMCFIALGIVVSSGQSLAAPTAIPPQAPLVDNAPIMHSPGLSRSREYACATGTYIDKHDPADHSEDIRYKIRPGEQVILLNLDLPCDVLAAANIDSALLKLWVTGKTNSQPLQLEAYQICAPWEASEATWTHRLSRVEWCDAGLGCAGVCGSLEADIPRYSLDNDVAQSGSWAVFNITDFVRAMITGTQHMQGLAIKASAANSVQAYIASSNHPYESWRPRLSVNMIAGEGFPAQRLEMAGSRPIVTACTGISSTITITATGAYGCPAADGTMVRLSSTLGSFASGGPVITLPIQGGLAATLWQPGNVAGMAQMIATTSGNVSSSLTLTISPGAAESLRILPIGDQEAERPFSVTVRAVDCGGNLDVTYDCPTATVTLSAGPTTLAESCALVGGVCQVTFVVTDVVTPRRATAIAEACDMEATSNAFTIYPPGPAAFDISTPAIWTACDNQLVTITARSWTTALYSYFTGTVSLTSPCGTIVPDVVGPFLGGIWSGEVELMTTSGTNASSACGLVASCDYAGRPITGTTLFGLQASHLALDALRPNNAAATTISTTVLLLDGCYQGMAEAPLSVLTATTFSNGAWPGWTTVGRRTGSGGFCQENLAIGAPWGLVRYFDVEVQSYRLAERRRLLKAPVFPLVMAGPRCEELISDGGYEMGPNSPWKQSRQGIIRPTAPGKICNDGAYVADVGHAYGRVDKLSTEMVLANGYASEFGLSLVYVYYIPQMSDRSSLVISISDDDGNTILYEHLEPTMTCDPFAKEFTLSVAQNTKLYLFIAMTVQTVPGMTPAYALLDNVSLRACYR